MPNPKPYIRGFCGRILFFCTLSFLFLCSSDSYLRQFDAHIKNGRFAEAVQVLHEVSAVDSLKPEYLIARLEYLAKAPDAYRFAQACALERQLANTAAPVLKTIRSKIYSDENQLFRFHLVRVLQAVAYPDTRWQKIYEQVMILALDASDTDVRRDVRREAVRAVARIPRENSDGLVLLLGALLTDSTETIRLAAAEALNKDLNVNTGKYVAISALKSKDVSGVLQALRTLKRMYLTRKELNTNILPLMDHPDTVISCVSAVLCEKKASKRIISLSSIALHGSSSTRIRDILSIGTIINPDNGGISATQLAVFITHTDPVVRQAAIEASVQYLPELLIPTLLNRLNTERDVQCRIALIDALGRLRADQAVPELISAFKSDIGRIRYESIIALGNIGASVVPAVIDSLASTHESVRKHSVIFLSHARDKRASEPLFMEFMDDDTEFALLAAQALISIRDSSLVDTLCVVAIGSSDSRALKAIQILGELGDERALETLTGIDKPKARQFQALAAVRKIKAQNSVADSAVSR